MKKLLGSMHLLLFVFFGGIIAINDASAAEKSKAERGGQELELDELQSRAIFAGMKKLREEYGEAQNYLISVKAEGGGAYVNFVRLDPTLSPKLPLAYRLSGGGVTYVIDRNGNVIQTMYGR